MQVSHLIKVLNSFKKTQGNIDVHIANFVITGRDTSKVVGLLLEDTDSKEKIITISNY